MDRLAKERLKVYYLGLRPWSRHSTVLLVAGLAYIGIGLAYFSAVVTSPSRDKALEFILELWSFKSWGITFMVVGALVIFSARWPPRSEKWGYTLLTGLSSVWAAGYLFSIIFRDSPVTNITAVLVWSLVAFLWWAISGLNNPPNTVVVVNGRR